MCAATRWPAPIPTPTPIRPSSNGPDTGRARQPGAEEWRRSGSGVLNVRHTIKRGRRGCEAAWSALRENFAGRFPASPISRQRSTKLSASASQPTISARAIPMASKAGQPSHRGNHETDYVGEPKRQAGVDKVGNWRNEGQVLPLCRLRRGLASGRARVACRIPLGDFCCDRAPSDLVLSAGPDHAP